MVRRCAGHESTVLHVARLSIRWRHLHCILRGCYRRPRCGQSVELVSTRYPGTRNGDPDGHRSDRTWRYPPSADFEFVTFATLWATACESAPCPIARSDSACWPAGDHTPLRQARRRGDDLTSNPQSPSTCLRFARRASARSTKPPVDTRTPASPRTPPRSAHRSFGRSGCLAASSNSTSSFWADEEVGLASHSERSGLSLCLRAMVYQILRKPFPRGIPIQRASTNVLKVKALLESFWHRCCFPDDSLW